MRIFGSISRLVSILFRKSGFDVTIEPSSASANTTFQLPAAGGGTKAIVTDDATQTLTNKTIVAVSNTITTAASGNLAATDLNTALAELQSDIDTRATATSVSDHLSDTSDAHDASAISFSPAGNIAATDVQAAIAELDTEKLSLSGGTMTGALTLSGLPSTPLHAATKSYVDNAINGLSWKQPVACATTANITLSGEQTIDGVLTSESRVLVKEQTTASENGIYVSAAGAWTRSTDMDSLSPLDEVNGAAVLVLAGTVNADRGFTQTAAVATLGTDTVTFTQFTTAGSYAAGTGIAITGNSIATDDSAIVHDNLSGFVANEHIDHSAVSISTAANSGLSGGGTIAATRTLAIDPNNATAETVASGDEILFADVSAANVLRKTTAGAIAALAAGSSAQAFTWTDGSATKVCTHTFATDDVLVELYDSTSKETVYADFVDRTGTNEVTVTRSEATVGSDWRVVIRN